MEASFGTGATGRAALEWVPDSIAIIGSDGEGAFTQHYFDPRGIVRVYAMTFSDGVWNLLGTCRTSHRSSSRNASPVDPEPRATRSVAAGRHPMTAPPGSTTSI